MPRCSDQVYLWKGNIGHTKAVMAMEIGRAVWGHGAGTRRFLPVWPISVQFHSPWNSHVHRECPGKFESTNLSRDNISREIGRTKFLEARLSEWRSPLQVTDLFQGGVRFSTFGIRIALHYMASNYTIS